jgi:hypothetical protein
MRSLKDLQHVYQLPMFKPLDPYGKIQQCFLVQCKSTCGQRVGGGRDSERETHEAVYVRESGKKK